MFVIKYCVYNNKDYSRTVYRKSYKEAVEIKENLEKLKHITEVKIEPIKDKKNRVAFGLSSSRSRTIK